jgi:hypothetical protein
MVAVIEQVPEADVAKTAPEDELTLHAVESPAE